MCSYPKVWLWYREKLWQWSVFQWWLARKCKTPQLLHGHCIHGLVFSHVSPITTCTIKRFFLKSTWHNRFILIHVDILSSYSQRWWKSLFFRTNRGILRQLGYPATWKSKDISSIFYLILKSYIISYHMYLDLIYINRYNVI